MSTTSRSMVRGRCAPATASVCASACCASANATSKLSEKDDGDCTLDSNTLEERLPDFGRQAHGRDRLAPRFDERPHSDVESLVRRSAARLRLGQPAALL